jgi:hypothetical protein
MRIKMDCASLQRLVRTRMLATCRRRCFPTIRPRRRRHELASKASPREVWIETESQQAFTAAIESGHATVLFPDTPEGRERAHRWRGLAQFRALLVKEPTAAVPTAPTGAPPSVGATGSAEGSAERAVAALQGPGVRVVCDAESGAPVGRILRITGRDDLRLAGGISGFMEVCAAWHAPGA